MNFQLDSDKLSFGLDNVPKFVNIEAAIVKMQCFKNESFFSTLNENMSKSKLFAYNNIDIYKVHYRIKNNVLVSFRKIR